MRLGRYHYDEDGAVVFNSKKQKSIVVHWLGWLHLTMHNVDVDDVARTQVETWGGLKPTLMDAALTRTVAQRGRSNMRRLHLTVQCNDSLRQMTRVNMTRATPNSGWAYPDDEEEETPLWKSLQISRPNKSQLSKMLQLICTVVYRPGI